VGGLEPLPAERRLASAAPLLNDPSRAVRVEAARVLASVSANLFDATQWQAFEAALEEYREAQLAQADLPPARLNLAVLHERLGKPALAEREYQTALRFNPGFLPARFNLANLYNRLGRNADAEAVLREGLRHAPDEGELHYSLALLLAEERRLDEAAEHLGRAVELLPRRARLLYNLGLLLQRLDRNADAERALLEAHELGTGDPDILYALAVFYAQQESWARALPYAQELAELAPQAPAAQQLLERIRGETRSD
jgi:tetratricopeptide (TPR) repeat protein